MRLLNSTIRTPKEVFDKFSKKEFDRTIVPIKMAKDDDLVSRSQARRILNGLELFAEVILDFKSIQYIGQAFADEIFRGRYSGPVSEKTAPGIGRGHGLPLCGSSPV